MYALPTTARRSNRWLLASSLSAALLIGGCASSNEEAASGEENASAAASAAVGLSSDLSKVNSYLVDKSTALHTSMTSLQKLSDRYYELAKSVGFDYAALWADQQTEVSSLILETKKLYLTANSSYETMEGIVAGVGELSHYDIDIDAGNPAGDGAEDVVSFDVKLPDGKTLEKPGNFFYLEELTLWGTNPEWAVQAVKPDLDGNGTVDFGEVLPDANVFKGFTDSFVEMSASLQKDAQEWKATPEDALTALVVMVPTMEEYFQAWKETRFVSGEQATSQQFVAVSRLQDIADILSGLQIVYGEMKETIAITDSAQAEQTGAELADLVDFVSELYEQEKEGIKFKPEQADTYGADAQNRATAIAGQITQAAAKMGIKIDA
jgi:hypothetical protein